MSSHLKHGKIGYFDMVKISFICPVYNKVKYLPNVLDSIKNQVGEFKKEFIFVNDGSTDDSLSYLRSVTSKWKNTKIINQRNKGPSHATQVGIKNSTGDFIKLVGGDDIMSPICTKILLNTIKKTNSVAVFSEYKLLNTYKKIKFKKQEEKIFLTINKPLKATILSAFSGTTPNLYSNEALKKSKGCDTRIFVEDFSLVLRLSKYGSFSFIKNVTCFGPKNDQNRIMLGQKNQLIHDYNAALYYFIKENINIKKEYKRIACKKALGRTEKWYRRTQKNTIFSKINYLRIIYYFSRNNEINLLKESCKPFYLDNRKSRKIRYRVI